MLATMAGECARAGPGWMTGIGDLPGGPTASRCLGVSRDGHMVVGVSANAGQPWSPRWVPVQWVDGTLSALGALPGGTTSGAAYAINNSGLWVGYSNSSQGDQACSGLLGNDPTGLGGTTAGGTHGSSAACVTDDGTTIAGYEETVPGTVVACLWNSGTIRPLITDPNVSSNAKGMTPDAGVVVGDIDVTDGVVACYWDSSRSLHLLTDLPGGFGTDSTANAISADGTMIVGRATDATGTKAVAWDLAGNLTVLGSGLLPNNQTSTEAYAVNRDGTCVVGRTVRDGGQVAFLWTPADGMRVLSDVLGTRGIDATGWTLVRATGISDDGLTIVGYGTNPTGDPEGFVVYLGTPCPADYNNDGFADIFDFTDFINCFEFGTCPPRQSADFNADGFVDVFDVTAFVTAFESGC